MYTTLVAENLTVLTIKKYFKNQSKLETVKKLKSETFFEMWRMF